MKKKILVACLCVALAVLTIAGTTLAYLTAKTDDVVNTFTVGNINISLDETKGGTNKEFKMVPGCTIDKDPVVTVKAGSEACWLFVKVDKSSNLDSFITYTIASGWTKGDGTNIPANVYYREVTAATADTEFVVLTNNQVTVKDTVTKTMMDEITKGTTTKPTLTFTAYAIQKAGFTTAADAWAEVSK